MYRHAPRAELLSVLGVASFETFLQADTYG
jgi:hypothetical protein